MYIFISNVFWPIRINVFVKTNDMIFHLCIDEKNIADVIGEYTLMMLISSLLNIYQSIGRIIITRVSFSVREKLKDRSFKDRFLSDPVFLEGLIRFYFFFG